MEVTLICYMCKYPINLFWNLDVCLFGAFDQPDFWPYSFWPWGFWPTWLLTGSLKSTWKWQHLHKNAQDRWLWKILRHYGLPQKIVDLISMILYQNFECSVLMEINQTNSFSVRSGVCQGCILSPILFNIALDYIIADNTEYTAWYIMASFFTTRRSRRFRWYFTIIHNRKSSAEEGTASHRKC